MVLKFIVMFEQTEKKLKNKQIRPTAMRQLVLEVLMTTQHALSLSDIQEKLDYADKSTIFRTLKTFEEKNIIHSIDDGSGSLKYALCQTNCEIEHNFHVHFVCEQCEKTYCMNQISIPTVSLPKDFSASSASMIVKGKCSNCNK